MYVHLKQSGELLGDNDQAGELWTVEGVRASTEKVATAYRRRRELGMHGLMIVSGAGNIIRGKQLIDRGIANGFPDVIGRGATIFNTLVLAAHLRDSGVPTQTFIAENMLYKDPSLSADELRPYSLDLVRQAYEDEHVVLVAGGTGEDAKSTDNAVLAYAVAHQEGSPDDQIVVLKGTKHDGVYTDDPAMKNARAKRYSQITAGYMLANYKRLGAVDESSLRTINETGVSLRVYRDGGHDLTAVLRDRDDVGTLIIQGEADVEPTLAA